MEEGYLTIATDKNRYVELALNLALSIKLKDKRPICLLHDDAVRIPVEYRKFFDVIAKIKKDDLMTGPINKLLLFEYSPFSKSMFIDSDCLLVKSDVSRIWRRLKKYNFTVRGWKFSENNIGPAKAFTLVKISNILQFMKENKLEYAVAYIGGAMYFDKSKISEKVFKKAKELHKKYKEYLSLPHRRINEYPEERFFGLAMGFYNLEPFPSVFKAMFKSVQWINELHGIKNCKMDVFRGICTYKFPGADHCESPTIVHFNFLKSKNLYLKESNKLREHFNLPFLKESSLENEKCQT